MIGSNGDGCQVCDCTGAVRITIAGETVEATRDFWRAVMFDMSVREKARAVVSRDLVEPVASGIWWRGDNGDGR